MEVTCCRLIHDGARAAAKVGATLSGWVEATLDIDGKPLTLRRMVKSRKQGADQWAPDELFFGKLGNRGREGIKLMLDEDGLYQTRARSMVPVLVVELNHLDAQPLQAGITALANRFGTAVYAQKFSLPVPHIAERGGGNDGVATILDSLAHEPLIFATAIHVGGVEEVYAQVDGTMDVAMDFASFFVP